MKRTIKDNKIYESHNKEKITCSSDMSVIMQNIYKYNNLSEQEAFYLIGLNANNAIKIIELSSLGTTNFAFPILKELVKSVILNNVVNVIICHNHPSGNLTPSVQDKEFTRKFKEIVTLIDVKLLDHIIIADNNYYSMQEKGDF
jgi:DNA repair protein RadC